VAGLNWLRSVELSLNARQDTSEPGHLRPVDELDVALHCRVKRLSVTLFSGRQLFAKRPLQLSAASCRPQNECPHVER
jgi:hypothetical protein